MRSLVEIMLKLLFCFALTAYAKNATCLDCEGLYWYDEFDDSGEHFDAYASEKCFEGKLYLLGQHIQTQYEIFINNT